jgi:hypothetical protein
MGRMPGWIANWKEVHDSGITLYRPRQVYVGPCERPYIPIEERGAGECVTSAPTPECRPSLT